MNNFFQSPGMQKIYIPLFTHPLYLDSLLHKYLMHNTIILLFFWNDYQKRLHIQFGNLQMYE